MLKVENLKKYYKTNDVKVKALDGVSFNIKKGAFISIIGAFGSGKSTLLHLIGGLDFPTEGKVYIDGIDIYNLKDDERTIFRRRHIVSLISNSVLHLLSIFAKTCSLILPSLVQIQAT